jgi:hypothetical protein
MFLCASLWTNDKNERLLAQNLETRLLGQGRFCDILSKGYVAIHLLYSSSCWNNLFPRGVIYRTLTIKMMYPFLADFFVTCSYSFARWCSLIFAQYPPPCTIMHGLDFPSLAWRRVAFKKNQISSVTFYMQWRTVERRGGSGLSEGEGKGAYIVNAPQDQKSILFRSALAPSLCQRVFLWKRLIISRKIQNFVYCTFCMIFVRE